MNRSMYGVCFALAIPLVLVQSVSSAQADEIRRSPTRSRAQVQRRLEDCRQYEQAQQKKQERIRAEQQRIRAEQQRIHAEQERIRAEQQRIRAEQQRLEKGYERASAQQNGAAPPAQPLPPGCPHPAQTEQGRQWDQQVPARQGVAAERRLCEDLAGKANLQIDEIDRGVAIVLTPKAGYTLPDLRRSIDELELAVDQHAHAPRPPVEQQCYLFDLYRRTGELPKVTEGKNIMALHFTTEDVRQVIPLRHDAYQFVCYPSNE